MAYCATTPITTGMGRLAIMAKSGGVSVSPMPNMMTPRRGLIQAASPVNAVGAARATAPPARIRTGKRVTATRALRSSAAETALEDSVTERHTYRIITMWVGVQNHRVLMTPGWVTERRGHSPSRRWLGCGRRSRCSGSGGCRSPGRRSTQSRSTQAALFGCSQPSSASGAALSSTVPAGSCTGSAPIATATKKSALRSQISRFPASTRQVPPSSGPKTSFFHSSRRSSSALVTSASEDSGSCCWSSIACVPQSAGCGSHGADA